MEMRTSIMNRRLGVGINYAGLALMLILWNIVVNVQPLRPYVLAGMIAMILVVVISFILVHLKTGLWKMIHMKSEDLDERELQVAHEALRHSYAWFTVITLGLVLVNILAAEAGFGYIDSVLVVSLIYLAHTLPSSILAWTQREV